ncbi:MAG TPA: glycosyltransferase, partial [Candidatus Marinimicrobia bacterium]|nr:glycosyltransferase [Candidatus Neomarinimicrobiota bacterium]
MNICIVTSSFSRGGDDSVNAGVFVRDFALELNKSKHKVFVLTPRKYGLADRDPELEVKFFNWLGGEASLTHLNPKNPVEAIKIGSVVLGGIKEILAFVKEKKIDLCLAMWAIPSGIYAWVAKTLFDVPFATWVLGSDVWRVNDYIGGQQIVKRILLDSDYLFADGLVLASDVEKISGRRCSFLPTSRNLPVNSIKPAPVDLSKTNFLFIGRWHPNKGIDLLIDAFCALSRERDDVFLYVFGGGPLESLIKKKIADYHLEEVIHLGEYLSTTEVVSYLQACDCLVIPSRIESIPVILSDAIQVDSPVIVTPVGDMAEIVKKFNIGLVASNASALAIKRAMLDFRSLSDSSCFETGL